ncbi:MAG: ABC transporter permease [Acidimicrobiales bacterium]
MNIGRVPNEESLNLAPPGRGLILGPSAIAGAVLLTALILVAGLAGVIAPGDPFDTSAGPALSPPSSENILGTDNLGRDLATGIVHGARTSMMVVLLVVSISGLIGLALGSISGFFGGVADDLIMRFAELIQVVPRFFMALLTIAYFGPGIDRLIILLGVTSWPSIARIVRIEVISLRSREFVVAARAAGASAWRVLGRNVVPKVLPSVTVILTLFSARVILIEAGLSFLGLGDQNRISWGALVNNAQQFLQRAWWMALFPGLALALAVLAFTLIGDALEASLDRPSG